MSTLGRSPRLDRARTGIAVLVYCCAGLSAAACSAGSGTRSPGASVTAPSVGRPAMPTSVAAAVAKEAFTPYAELGATGDGLAPNATSAQLATACMTAAGYAGDAGDVQFGIRVPAYLGSDGAPFGQWGYVGTAAAARDGFTLGPGLGPPPATGSSGLSAGAQAAVNKCSTIVMDFSDAQQNSSLAGIQAMYQTMQNELNDPSIVRATKAWSACMTANGYQYPDPNTLLHSDAAGSSNSSPTPPTPLTPAQKAAQIAVAEADAACTQSTDLAGIYFAVQASYEQQIVDANQQQLTNGVQQYRAAYQKELGQLPALLAATPTTSPGNGPRP